VEAWPSLLPEYRWCRILERSPERLVFAMGGWIRGWPARWAAVQEAHPEQRRLTFRHIAGITRGLEVEWLFAPDGNAVDVELVHDLTMHWPLVGRLAADLVIGPVFIDFIARKTLQAVKRRAEAAGSSERTGGTVS
jgi:ribosome-associated toxin RatA of RatAB toxin-antitoxin module